MPSFLTPRVLLKLLYNEPILFRGCLRRNHLHHGPHRNRVGTGSVRIAQRSILHRQQRRSFFNLFQTAKRQVREVDTEPGLEKMQELSKMIRMRARPPPWDEVADALRKFFKRKMSKKTTFPDNQAAEVSQSLKYCLENSPPDDDGLNAILEDAARVIHNCVDSPSAARAALAKAVYEALTTRNSAIAITTAFPAYIQELSSTGQTQQARDLLYELEKSAHVELGEQQMPQNHTLDDDETNEGIRGSDEASSESPVAAGSKKVWISCWLIVLRGFSVEGEGEKFRETVIMVEARGFDRSSRFRRIMLDHHLKHDSVEDIRTWLNDFVEQTSQDPSCNAARCMKRILNWCIERSEYEIGNDIVKKCLRNNPQKLVWDAIFVWAAATKKSVDEIDRMISVMEASNANGSASASRRPNINTINKLLEFAIGRNDAYMAERIIAMGKSRGIDPNARTYVLQVEHRLKVNDINAALLAYQDLQATDLDPSDDDISAVNRLIVALCTSPWHDFETVMNVAADLSDRRARFEAETVAALSSLHLKRGEFDDVTDLLNTHVFHFDSVGRGLVRETILKFCLDAATPTGHSWETFKILRTTFDELTRDERTKLMTHFIQRERPDMGVHIFHEMRRHSRADTIPTADTYVTAFLSLGEIRDLDGVEVIHNQMKLDYNLDYTTRLYDGLMVAYTSCKQPRKALACWNEIFASREGPRYQTLHIILRACEIAPFGDLEAQNIWGTLREKGVDLDQNLWASYIAALAGNGNNQLAFSAMDGMVKNGEAEVDAFMLGSLLASGAGQAKRQEIQAWAEAHHPASWQELEAKGFVVDRSVAV